MPVFTDTASAVVSGKDTSTKLKGFYLLANAGMPITYEFIDSGTTVMEFDMNGALNDVQIIFNNDDYITFNQGLKVTVTGIGGGYLVIYD